MNTTQNRANSFTEGHIPFTVELLPYIEDHTPFTEERPGQIFAPPGKIEGHVPPTEVDAGNIKGATAFPEAQILLPEEGPGTIVGSMLGLEGNAGRIEGSMGHPESAVPAILAKKPGKTLLYGAKCDIRPEACTAPPCDLSGAKPWAKTNIL